jgi:nucleotide-binding universal stress UspA family protein
MMTGSIICGVDDSEPAKGAARIARRLSSRLGLRLVFVRVVEPGTAEKQITAIAERLERLSACTTEVDCGAGWLVDVGHPADRWVAAASDEEARLIVVGSTGPRSSLLGRVSAAGARRAPCPVVGGPPGADVGGDALADAIARFGRDSRRSQAPTSNDLDARDLPGGIVRFGLGGQRGRG